MLLTFDFQKFQREDQGGIGRDCPGDALRAIRFIRRDGQLPLAAFFHADNSFVPSFDHPTHTDRRLKWLPARIRAIKYVAGQKFPLVMNDDCIAAFYGTPIANGNIFHY